MWSADRYLVSVHILHCEILRNSDLHATSANVGKCFTKLSRCEKLSTASYIHPVFFGWRGPADLELEREEVCGTGCACDAVSVVGPLVQHRPRRYGFTLTVHRHREAGYKQQDNRQLHH